jgi:hypothetical protein
MNKFAVLVIAAASVASSAAYATEW